MIALRYPATRIASLVLTLIMGFTSPLLAAGPPEVVLYNFGVNGFADAIYPAGGMVAVPADRLAGVHPVGQLAQGPAGDLFGGTEFGGNGAKWLVPRGCGVVSQLPPPAMAGSPWTQSVLLNFGSPRQDGVNPLAGV